MYNTLQAGLSSSDVSEHSPCFLSCVLLVLSRTQGTRQPMRATHIRSFVNARCANQTEPLPVIGKS